MYSILFHLQIVSQTPIFEERVTQGENWDENKIKQAILRVQEKRLSVIEAANIYYVPRSTFQDRNKALSANQNVKLKTKLRRFDHTFSEQYSELVYNHTKDLDNCLMPLIRIEFLKLAFQCAEHLQMPHCFHKEKKKGGKNFFYSFTQQYPDMVL